MEHLQAFFNEVDLKSLAQSNHPYSFKAHIALNYWVFFMLESLASELVFCDIFLFLFLNLCLHLVYLLMRPESMIQNLPLYPRV